MTDTIIHNHCNGCCSLSHDLPFAHTHICAYHIYNTNAECPCAHCVVKVMCDLRCDKFEVFATDVLAMRGEL